MKGMVIVNERIVATLLTGIVAPVLSVKVISIVSEDSISEAPGVLA